MLYKAIDLGLGDLAIVISLPETVTEADFQRIGEIAISEKKKVGDRNLYLFTIANSDTKVVKVMQAIKILRGVLSVDTVTRFFWHTPSILMETRIIIVDNFLRLPASTHQTLVSSFRHFVDAYGDLHYDISALEKVLLNS